MIRAGPRVAGNGPPTWISDSPAPVFSSCVSPSGQQDQHLASDAMRVALDAMGGDFAPGPIVTGACEAVADHPDLTVVLVGDRDGSRPSWRERPRRPRDRLPIVHASQVDRHGREAGRGAAEEARQLDLEVLGADGRRRGQSGRLGGQHRRDGRPRRCSTPRCSCPACGGRASPRSSRRTRARS